MNYIEDAKNQFNNICKDYPNKVVNIYKDEIIKIFYSIYELNYLCNRIELRKFYNSNYFDVSFSCLLESFSLILDNYPRGATLVMRSSLENFLKYIIEFYNKYGKFEEFYIDDRKYTCNKVTLNNIIEKMNSIGKISNEVKSECISLNGKMEMFYKKFSGISHSLVPENRNTISYFDEIRMIKENHIKTIIDNLKEIVNIFVSFALILGIESFKNWNLEDLREVVEISFGKKKTKTYIKLIKN